MKVYGILSFVLLAAPPGSAVDFQKDIQPLLASRCYACHGAAQAMSGLRLDDKAAALKGGYSGAVILPGNAAGSKVLLRVSGAPGMVPMPPAGPRLSPAQVATLRAWIDGGAVWPDSDSPAPAVSQQTKGAGHWAFQSVRERQAPAVRQAEWVRNPIDAFILARLEKQGLTPSPEAARKTLLRRLSLDLTGLPPTPEEMASWSAQPYERTVDQLLASPHFGERWARPWLDRARYADSDGYEKDWVRPYAWRYRQWVIDALNRDLPFDQFTIQQIAGDLLPGAGTEQKVATGFHRQTLTNREGGIDNRQFRFEGALDRTNTVASVWLGLTAGCAQCHDHKFDPITQRDYYSLFAFFEPLEEVDIDAPMPGELGPYLHGKGAYRARREALLADYQVPARQAAWETEMLDAEAHPGRRTDWDLAWDCLLKLTEFGDGERIIHVPREQRTQRQADILTDHFVRNYHFAVGQKRYQELKFPEIDRKLQELKTEFPQLTQAMTVAALPGNSTHIRVRGDYRTNGIEVTSNVPAFLPPLPTIAGAPTRLDLARWIVSPGNPLTARVTVNWVWQELFGRGLVKSAEDFGTRGDAPTQPEALDWMAARFTQEGWSLKSAIRTIVTSATYRQASTIRPAVQAKDPENALYSRQNRVRLPAELIRDSALAASGLLNDEIGGPSIRPPQPDGVASLGYGKKDESGWKETTGRERYRRGLYIQMQRSTPYPLLMNFDAPRASVAQCRRDRSNTPLQALNLLNDPVFLEAAEALAYLAAQAGADFDARAGALYQRALGRTPSPLELASLRGHYRKLSTLFDASPEKARELAPVELPGTPIPQAAAWVSLATAVLNLDEFITRE